MGLTIVKSELAFYCPLSSVTSFKSMLGDFAADGIVNPAGLRFVPLAFPRFAFHLGYYRLRLCTRPCRACV